VTRSDLVVSGSGWNRETGSDRLRHCCASIFAEGLYQLVLTLRLTLDPVLAPLVAHDRWNELRELTRRVRRGSYAFTLAFSLVAVMLYPYALEILVGNDDFAASWKVFGTLATGIVPSASYIPFSGLLQQAGFPGTQSLLITLVMLTNVAGNILLIPAFGALGAAAATAFSQVCFVFVLRRLVARKLAFSL
jgi:O-antigen/teichoic acid export membrane protein